MANPQSESSLSVRACLERQKQAKLATSEQATGNASSTESK